MSNLPIGWSEVSLSEINFYAPMSINPLNFGNEIFELYSVPSFPQDAPEILTGNAIGSTKQVVQPADILICKINPRINRVWQVKPARRYKQIASSEWIVVRAPEFYSGYLRNYFSSPVFRNLIVLDVTGVGGSLTRAQPKRVATFSVPVAPFNEHKRIAEKLDALFAHVDSCKSRLEHISQILKLFRQYVLAAATSGQLTEAWRSSKGYLDKTTRFDFLDANSFEEYEFPATWQAKRLRDIADVKSGITKDSKKQDLTDKEFPYLRVANVQRGYFDLSEIKTIRVPKHRAKELFLRDGDILFNEGGDIDKLGRGWVWSGEIEHCVFQNHVFRVRLKNSNFVPKYFSHYGNSRGYNYFLQNGKQTTNLASINKTILESLPIAVPSAEEQLEIVSRIEKLFALADHIEACWDMAQKRVTQLSSSLLRRAFRGELVEQDPNDEPAEKLLQRMKVIRKAEKERKKAEPRKKKEKKMRAKIERKSLYETLLQTGIRLTPEDLFTHAGFDKNSIDEFYEELRVEIKQKRIEEIRQGSEKVYLKRGSK